MVTKREAEQQTFASGDVARLVIGAIWLGGAAFNALVIMRIDDAYAWLRESPIPMYQWFFSDVVSARPAFWTAMLVLVEVLLGVLTIARGRWAQLGLAAGALLSAFLFSLGMVYTIIMGPYAWLLVALARQEFPHSAPAGALRALRQRRAKVVE